MGMRKAVIDQETGKVINIIECSDEGLRGLQFPLWQLVWDCSQYPVGIGDDFLDGIFTRDGGPLEPLKTVEQQLAELELVLSAKLDYIGMAAEVL